LADDDDDVIALSKPPIVFVIIIFLTKLYLGHNSPRAFPNYKFYIIARISLRITRKAVCESALNPHEK
jgi:hypothetical protein